MTPFLNTILILLALAAAMAMPAALAADALTEAEVRAFVKQGDAYIQQRNFQKVLSMMAPDAVFEYSSRGNTRRLNLAQYSALLRQSYASLPPGTRVSYRTQVQSVQIQGSQAVVQSVSYEDITLNGQTIHSVSHEASRIEKTNGRLWYKAVRAQVSVKP